MTTSSNKPIPINETTFRILYFRFKPYLISTAVILVCIILFFQFIIPQIGQWFALRDQVIAEQQKIDVLNQNLNIITKINNATLDKDIQITAAALPSQKDFAAILDAVSNAATTANVSLGDYSFQVGNLSDTAVGSQTNLQLILSIKGGITDVERFIQSLKTQVPLSDVTNVQINSASSSTLTTVFYFKPFPQFAFNSVTPLIGITAQDDQLIKSLEAYGGESNITGPLTIPLPTPPPSPAVAQ
ncbi:MAG TPA: hypothetical protein VF820_03050 [Patescibacteria group bacterium]